MRVALFITCVTDTVFPDTGRATVRLLERLGHEVAFPVEQTCCGQLTVQLGDDRSSHILVPAAARRHLRELFLTVGSASGPAGVDEHEVERRRPVARRHAARCSPTPSGGRRCTASAARPA